MSKVVAVVGARLNSSRLPGKHLLELAGQPVIARIFQRLAQVAAIDKVILATTADDYNRPLVGWALSHGHDVLAFAGDVNNLVARVDAVVQAEQPDLVAYICGDSPLIEPSTLAALIRAHQEYPEADWVELAPPPTGKYIHEGYIVYRRSLWARIVAASTSADDKEHVGSVMKRLRPELNIRQIEDTPLFATVDHRISVDTPSDYAFMGEVYRRWYAEHSVDSIVSLPWVIGELARDPALAAINGQVRQKAVGEHSLPILLVCHAGPGLGLGHLARCLILARVLQDRHFAGVRLLIQGAPLERADLALLPHRFIPLEQALLPTLQEEVANKPPRALILDLHPAHHPAALADFLDRLPASVLKVGIDSIWPLAAHLDLLNLPAFHVAADILAACDGTPVLYGWPHFLLRPSPSRQPWQPGHKILVLTGGSDTTHLGAGLPEQLDAALPTNDGKLEIHWVRGPYAPLPQLPQAPRHTWKIHQAPDDLGPLMAECQYALTIYGVSLFELLAQGVPTVVFSPYGQRDTEEIAALRQEQLAQVAEDVPAALAELRTLLGSPKNARRLADAGPRKVDGQGAARLADALYARLEQQP